MTAMARRDGVRGEPIPPAPRARWVCQSGGAGMTAGRVWFVTGAGRGIGRHITQAALEVGDRVVATARRPEVLDDLQSRSSGRLVVLPLDVADRLAVFAAVDQAVAAFGGLDVVVNNAGYGLMGAVEEITEAQARAVMDTNFFGALWVTQAALPRLRAQRSGHIVQISTVGAVGTFPTLSMYNASKWALEGFSDALAQEVARFDIKVTIVEPGGVATDWASRSMRHATPLAAYDELRAEIFGATQAEPDSEGEAIEADPAQLARAILTLVDRPDPPLRQLVGDDAYDAVQIALARRRDDYRRDPRVTWPG